jgi:hypothetical protein
VSLTHNGRVEAHYISCMHVIRELLIVVRLIFCEALV